MELVLVWCFFRKLFNRSEQSALSNEINESAQYQSRGNFTADAFKSSSQTTENVGNDRTSMTENSRKQQSVHVLKGHASVIDGDTITIGSTQIRLFGVDAPELTHPHGQRAKAALTNLVKERVIRAKIANERNDNRVMARCYLPDGRDLSAEMVKIGLALDWPKYSGGVYKQLESRNIREKLWLTEAHQKGNVDLWNKFEANLSRKR